MRRLADLPLLVILTGLVGLAMLLPAVHAYDDRNLHVARSFFYSGLVTVLLTVLVGVAMAGRPAPPNPSRSRLAALAGAFLLLPPVMAVPFHEALDNTTFLNAWFEMVSSFTTTGATMYPTPGRLVPALHLWRGLAGWMGGLFVLIAAAAILAPLALGGAEVVSGRIPGRAEGRSAHVERGAGSARRLSRETAIVAPAYLALTLALWVGLLVAGERGLQALMMAMATVSTSGILAGGQGDLHGSVSGLAGEMMIFGVMLLALTRRSLPGGAMVDRSRPLWQDPELRLAGLIMLAVPGLLFLRHWAVLIEVGGDTSRPLAILSSLWGLVFTTLSFLTTTGLESAHWQAARAWSALGTPGLVLVGLAMMGGGVATTAGGLKLLRVHALIRHGQHELDRLVHPHAVSGGGPLQRHLATDGAYAAWVFFMLFALSMAVGIGALGLAGIPFEAALVLATAALTTTGSLSAMAMDSTVPITGLPDSVKTVMAALMILGRVEVLAVLALVLPQGWRS